MQFSFEAGMCLFVTWKLHTFCYILLLNNLRTMISILLRTNILYYLYFHRDLKTPVLLRAIPTVMAGNQRYMGPGHWMNLRTG